MMGDRIQTGSYFQYPPSGLHASPHGPSSLPSDRERYLAELLAEKHKLGAFMQILPLCTRLLYQVNVSFNLLDSYHVFITMVVLLILFSSEDNPLACRLPSNELKYFYAPLCAFKVIWVNILMGDGWMEIKHLLRVASIQDASVGWPGLPGVPTTPIVKRVVRLDVPVDKYPNNFVVRFLGPRGNSLNRVEAVTDCRVYIRGKGSVKDSVKEEKLKNKPGYEHLNEPLHLLLEAEFPENMINSRLDHAVGDESLDNYKKQQLRELALLNEICRARESVTVKERLAPLNRPFGTANPGHLLDLKTSTATGIEIQVSSIVPSLISSVVKLKLALEPGNCLLTTSRPFVVNSGPFVVKLNLRCLESNILRCEIEIGSEIGKLLLTSSGPFVVKLNLHCMKSNILRCEVEIGSEIGKLLLTNNGPFVVKLNLRCLKSNILCCEVEIGSEIKKLLLTSSGPFVVKLNLRCLESNILRCEVEIGSEIEKLLLTGSGPFAREVELAFRPFVVKLNLCCLECHDILRRGVEIAYGPFVVKLSLDLNILRREVEIQVLYVADILRREVEIHSRANCVALSSISFAAKLKLTLAKPEKVMHICDAMDAMLLEMLLDHLKYVPELSVTVQMMLQEKLSQKRQNLFQGKRSQDICFKGNGLKGDKFCFKKNCLKRDKT
ncbi:Smg-4/UPF3 family protein, putative isoform 1 [Hibiscus syriacus]|uniref:Smg-4/UPF3 family protein, putative isoform 1 n=1 Tax=Hibiscus syriacus TaxID=106335 RepID=A0A6A3BTF5_HIBSY|nr:Smg-4/UPF3 family protein, putative isoform 1 [Hibiscus syriacus]